MIETNVARISSDKAADVLVEKTTYGLKLRQGSSWIAMTVEQLDEVVEVVDTFTEDSPRLGHMFTHEVMTPAKYCAVNE